MEMSRYEYHMYEWRGIGLHANSFNSVSNYCNLHIMEDRMRNPQYGWKERIPDPPEVSLCVHTYLPNQEGYFRDRGQVIHKTLNSLINTVHPWQYELIIWDNNSTPEFKESIDWYPATKIFSRYNVGPYRARKAMYHLARGKYLMFTDDDVLFLPGWYEAQKAIIESNPGRPIIVGGTPETPNPITGASHMQFLTERETFPNYQEPNTNCSWHWARPHDVYLVRQGTLGFNTDETVVRHIGREEL
jgi:glycosyltransferase involved in cell wall biosynthesis